MTVGVRSSRATLLRTAATHVDRTRLRADLRSAVPLLAHAVGIAASFAISLAMALVSWRMIEEPILRFKTRRTPMGNAASDAA